MQLNENGRPWYLARSVGGAAHSLDGGFEDQPQSGPVHSGDFQETVHHGDNAVHERQAPECRLGEVWAVTARYQKNSLEDVARERIVKNWIESQSWARI